MGNEIDSGGYGRNFNERSIRNNLCFEQIRIDKSLLFCEKYQVLIAISIKLLNTDTKTHFPILN